MKCIINTEIDSSAIFLTTHTNKVTSLEAQVCLECGDTIPPGVEFWKATGIYDDNIDIDIDNIDNIDNLEDVVEREFVANTCEICEGLRRFLCVTSYGSLYEDIDNGIMYDDDPFEVENSILMSINYTELQWLLRFDVLNLDNDMDNDED